MMNHRWSLSPKTKAALAVALAFLLWVPQGISTDTQPVVTGHSTFYNGESYDPCLASVAGIVRSRVMWFNDQVLVERYPGKGTYVYITENGGEDPTTMLQLNSEGVSYNFVDPNGAAWHVDELFIDHGKRATQDVKTPDASAVENVPGTNDPPGTVPGGNSVNTTDASVKVGFENKRQYVWAVELAAQPIYDQFPGSDPHSYYNFLDLVDTCKFHNNTATYVGETVHDTGLGPSNGHEAGATAHTHQVWNADIYLGHKPVVVMDGVNPYGAEYDTTWAVTGGPQSSASSAQHDASWRAGDAQTNSTAVT